MIPLDEELGRVVLIVFLYSTRMELHADTHGVLADSLPKRKGARADEWNGLEHRRGFRPTVGSNPTPSAIF